MAEREPRARLHREHPIVPQPPAQPMKALPAPPGDFSDLQEDEFRDQQDDLLEALTNHYTPYEGYDLLITTFEKTINGSVRATFKDGMRLAEVREDVVKPKIGITFLAGADTPQVNQMEEIQMTQTTPDQKDASWRVMTAGALLSNLTVRKDMTISFSDNTAAVVDAARRRPSSGSDGPFTQPSLSSKALAVRRATDRFVTIESDNVKIVNDLSSEKWDLDSLLVEVDQSSLMSLISNYQRVIRRGGPDLPTVETLQLLDVMIEDARRLCVRSPILFRMSTRRLIISSKNTRYGVDDGTMFKTLTTSAGIKNILSLSASYFNTLNKSESRLPVQQDIRPRFLQMLVLLLALLNDDDLAQLEDFLEDTYRVKADRQNLELLILKVLPLSSINSKIFLRALVSAFDGPLVQPSSHREDQPRIWNIFICRLLQQGYMLPGTIDQLGCLNFSWVLKWPDEGFKDSSVFKNLQYSGKSRTINEIPPINLNPEVSSTELTVILANGGNFIISNVDLENIIRMTPGRYTASEAGEGGRSFDLNISDIWVNQPLFRAIGEINSVLGLVKSILPTRPRSEIVRRIDHLLRSKSLKGSGARYEDGNLPEIKGCGRLTYHVAQLNGHYLALACKVDGRKISRRELIRHLHTDQNKMDVTMRAIQATMAAAFEGKNTSNHVRQTVFRLQEAMAQIAKMVAECERRKNAMLGFDAALANEPVSKVLYQVGANETQSDAVWSDYSAWHQVSDNVLYIEAHRRVVQHVAWQGDTLVVTFHGVPTRYFAAPLRQLEEHEKWEELKINDRVLLCGHYLLVVEMSDDTFVPSANGDGIGQEVKLLRQQQQQQRGQGRGSGLRYEMGAEDMLDQQLQQIRPVPLEMVVHWLKVTGIEVGVVPRRHKNRQEEAKVCRTAIR